MANPIYLAVGDILKDWNNRYVVLASKNENSHSQYASHYQVECLEGYHKGRTMWVGNSDLGEYLPGGKYYSKPK
jgi:hypothetical protein